MARKPPPPVVSPAVGERRNYNFQDPDNYTLWPFRTIEQLADEEQSGCRCYRARVGVVGNKLDPELHVLFNSFHQDFSDAERAIEFARSKIPTGELYNVFGETLGVHTSALGGGKIVTVVEVRVLIWSMMDTGP